MYVYKSKTNSALMEVENLVATLYQLVKFEIKDRCLNTVIIRVAIVTVAT